MIRLLLDLGEHLFLCIIDVDLGPVFYFKEDLYKIKAHALSHKYEYVLGIVAETYFISCECLSCQHFELIIKKGKKLVYVKGKEINRIWDLPEENPNRIDLDH